MYASKEVYFFYDENLCSNHPRIINHAIVHGIFRINYIFY